MIFASVWPSKLEPDAHGGSDLYTINCDVDAFEGDARAVELGRPQRIRVHVDRFTLNPVRVSL